MRISKRMLVIMLAVVVFIGFVSSLFMIGLTGWWMPGGMMHSYPLPYSFPPMRGWNSGIIMALGQLIMLGFVGAVITGMILLVNWPNRTTTATTSAVDPRDTPAEILRRRYAAGEITEREYARMCLQLTEDTKVGA